MKKEKEISRRQLIKGAVGSGIIAAGWSGKIFAAPAKKEIAIAVCTSLSGPMAYMGKSSVQGAELAVEEKNAKGGMAGRMFKLIVGDDAGNPKEAIPFLRRALMSDNAVAVTGIIFSDVALAAKGFLEERKVANIPVMGIVNQLVTEGTRYTFRVMGSTNQCLIGTGQFLKFKGVKRVAMIHEDSSYGRDCAKDFVPEVQKQGLELVAVKITPFGDTNFIPILNELKGINPEAIFMIFSGAVNLFARKQMVEVGLKPEVILGAQTISLPYFVEGLKDLVLGCYMWYRATKDPKIQELERIYKAKYNRELDVVGCLGYDCVNIITDAVIRANSDDPEAIRNEIAKTRYDGISGYRVEFSKNGDGLKVQFYIGQWQKADSGYRVNEVWHSDVIPPRF